MQSLMSYTLYDILEVSPGASPEIIRSAYRTLARQYHPDKNPGHGSVELMADINRAYATLSDPLKRKGYDASRASDSGTEAADRNRGFQRHRRAEAPSDAHGPRQRASDSAPERGRKRWGFHEHEQHSSPGAQQPPDARPAADNVAPGQQSSKKQWVFVLGAAALAAGIAGAFTHAVKDIEVTDSKDGEIAGQWRRYNEQAPQQAADAYFTGQGAAQNYEKARKLYLKIGNESRARKNPHGTLDERGRLALRRLGEIFAKGLGVDRDWQQAKNFYAEAATSGDIPSMVALAEYYSAEKATHTDLLAAYAWYNKLAAVTPGAYSVMTPSDNGETYRMLADASRKRDALEKKLSTDELRRAQGL